MTGIRRIAAAGFAAGALLATSACSGGQLGSSGLSQDDAYRIGCPALDSALATGSVARKAAVASLSGIRAHADLDPDSKKWVDAALGLVRSANPKDAPSDARSIIVDGCRKHGYRLQNLQR